MSLFEELKRRNVFRVGIAYAVAAWIILQAVDVVGEILELPAWAGKLILLIVAVGFILALILAWAFEMTPEGIKRENEVDRSQSITPQTGKKLNNFILVAMALAIGYLLYDKFSPETEKGPNTISSVQLESAIDEQKTDPSPILAEPADTRKSIAVLPFDNRSRLEEDEFFVEGVHDDLLTTLARIGSLKVISRTSVLRYKNTEKPIPEIAKELGVATIMEGAVQRSGNTVRINVQLIDATTDEHLWAEIFDRELTAENLFAIQSEISGKIAKALEATLSPEEQERISDQPTDNLAAYNAYLRGRQLMTRRNSADMEQAAKEMQRAVELDPEFSLAWVGVAEIANLLSTYSTLSWPESLQTQKEATERALKLNDQLGEAYLAQASLHRANNEWEATEAAYRKAIELSPGYASAYQWYGGFLRVYPRRLREALAIQEEARELDPMSSIIRLDIGQTLMALGDFEGAEAKINEALSLDPDFAPAYQFMSRLMQVTGRFDQQVFWIKKSFDMDPGRVNLLNDLAFAYLDLGDDEALAEIRAMIEEIDDQSWVLGMVDTWQNFWDQNYAGALESGQWVNRKLGNLPDFQNFFGWVYMIAGDYEKALNSFETWEPLFKDKNSWRAAIELHQGQGCINGWLMMQTGNETQGRELVDQALAYLEDELPRFIDHADRYNYSGCYLAIGNMEKALDAFELSNDHGHYNAWWLFTQIPIWEPVRGNPRFEASLRSIRKEVTIQRENLKRMEAGTTL